MKKISLLFVLLIIIFPNLILAQEANISEEIFEAKVLEILEEKEIIRENGSKNLQQNIKLKGLEKNWINKEFDYQGISEIDVIGSNTYTKGDKVLVSRSQDPEGNDIFYIIDYIRRGKLYLLASIFFFIIILIGRGKGLRAIISLGVSFIIIMKFIVPKILTGGNPLVISLISSFIILLFITYFTDGLNKKSHLAIFSILISLLITGLLSFLFTSVSKLTGMAQEETMFLISNAKVILNFKGLLLAAIIIGTLGVLDDLVIGQLEAIEQLKKTNPNLTQKEIFKMSFKIGNSHLGAVINTLFLAYAGASLPLLLLFSLKEPPFVTFSQVINHEIIATEIVRTLTGSIGLILSVPITSYLGSYFYSRQNNIFSKPLTN